MSFILLSLLHSLHSHQSLLVLIFRSSHPRLALRQTSYRTPRPTIQPTSHPRCRSRRRRRRRGRTLLHPRTPSLYCLHPNNLYPYSRTPTTYIRQPIFRYESLQLRHLRFTLLRHRPFGCSPCRPSKYGGLRRFLRPRTQWIWCSSTKRIPTSCGSQYNDWQLRHTRQRVLVALTAASQQSTSASRSGCGTACKPNNAVCRPICGCESDTCEPAAVAYGRIATISRVPVGLSICT